MTLKCHPSNISWALECGDQAAENGAKAKNTKTFEKVLILISSRTNLILWGKTITNLFSLQRNTQSF